MKRIWVVCEGQTEEAFVRTVLCPAFFQHSLHLQGQTINSSPGHKGGALNYDRVRRHVRNSLCDPNVVAVTTMFDLYGLNADFPSFAEASKLPLDRRLLLLSKAFHDDVIAAAGCSPDKFIPYIQPYEFEALLFSDVQTLVELEQGWVRSHASLATIRAKVKTPENINDSPATKPAAHLQQSLKNPKFHKLRHGPIAAQRIGLAKMEEECHHFAAWLAALRRLDST